MLKTLFILIGLISQFLFFSQANFILNKSASNELIIDFYYTQKAFTFTEINGINHIDFNKSEKNVLLKKGVPALPYFTTSIQLKDENPAKYEVLIHDSIVFDNVHVSPAKGNLTRNINPSSIPYTFGEIYNENQFYPQSTLTSNDVFQLRSLHGQALQLFPYRYNPVTKTLVLYTKLSIKVQFEKESFANEIKAIDSKNFKHLFINEIKSIEKYNPIEEQGELIIVSPANYIDSLQDFIAWKNAKGVKTSIITVSNENPGQIKNLIRDKYLETNAIFLLLIGDHEQIPTYSYGLTQANEDLYSDTYYAQLEGNDNYPELFVGRFSGSVSQVALMARRSIAYEKTPSLGDWYHKAIGIASSEGAGYGDDGQADWQHSRAIGTQLTNDTYTYYHEFYEGSRNGNDATGNPNPTIILPAVNEGSSLINYTGHGDINVCVTGNFSSNNINQATNVGKFPFVVSVACNNGTFVGTNCISETWLKASKPEGITGAIAACGSSILMSWAPPMETQDEMANLIVQSNPNNIKTTLGGLFYNAQLSMLEKYPDPNEGGEVMKTWIFFGDPSVSFRKVTPEELIVDESFCNDQFIFSANKHPLNITLSQEGNVIQQFTYTGETDTLLINNYDKTKVIHALAFSNEVVPSLTPLFNQSTCSSSGNLPIINNVYPNPFTNELVLSFANPNEVFSYQIYDYNGKIVLEDKNQAFEGKHTISTKNIENGIYFIRVNCVSFDKTFKVLKLD